jgi:hypothetical protein
MVTVGKGERMRIQSHTKPMTLEERVATLEHERRMNKRMCQVTMILLLCGGALVGTTAMVPAIETENGDLGKDSPVGHFVSITTRELKVEDEAGDVRAILGTEKEIHGDRRRVFLNMLDSTDKDDLSLEAGGALGPSLSISRVGVGSVRVASGGSTPTILILDAQGEAGALLYFMNGSPHLVMNDQKGKIRAMIGYEGVGKGSKGKPSTMAIYDTEGRVLWSAIENPNEAR